MGDATKLPQAGDVVAGNYRVEAAIGSGGMGAVYRARHEKTGKVVALKWLRPKLAEQPNAGARLLREARAAARVHHPNVVDVYGIEEQDGQAFLVLELLEGQTLRELLRSRRLAVDECLSLLLPAMRGVAAAHAQGVVHRDIKPDNIFITNAPDPAHGPTPKVLDFGISKLAADTPMAEGTLTATGAILGTPHYMSLEQLQGEEADARSDVYAFGVVLYECLTGVRPFDSENFSAIVVKVATETPRSPRSLCPAMSPELEGVVLKAMSRHREDRYQSMQALIDELHALVAEAPSTALQAPQAPSTGAVAKAEDVAPTLTSERGAEAKARRVDSRWRWAAGLVALASMVGATVWSRSSTGPDEATQTASVPTPAASSAPPTPPAPAAPANNVQAPQAGPPSVETPTPPAPLPTDGAPGTDTPAAERTPQTRPFSSGWVYLGDYADGRWTTRYFNGWGQGTPAVGTRITARGRSNVRLALPDTFGSLAAPRTTIGSENPVEILELSYWQRSSFLWARVRPVR